VTDGVPRHVVDATMFWSATGGGVRRTLLAKQAWFSGRPGWRHTIAVPGADRATAGFARLGGVPLPASGGYRLPLSRRSAARTLAGLAPDVIEAGDPYRIAWAALDAADALGIPAVAYAHSNLARMASLVGGRTAGRWAEAYLRRLYRRFDRVLAPSRAMADALAAMGIGQVEVQPLGVDLSVFDPARASSAWRAAQGFDGATRVCVYAGRFAAEKHLPTLVAAVERLGPPHVLLLVGAGPLPPRRSERVRVLDFVPNTVALATVFASADCFVHAGDQETFGLSLLEALACGTPAVVRRAGGLPEILDAADGGNAACGIAVDSADPGAFAEAIRAVTLSDAAVHVRRRTAARSRAETFGWNRVLGEVAERYTALMEAGR
jgi:alpha-1,6-mannosyltransferase